MNENNNIKEFKERLNDYLKELKNMDYDRTKRVWFLFGAGFNFNISDNAMSWKNLAENAFNNYLQTSIYKKSQLERKGIIREISSSIGNKMMLSIVADAEEENGKKIKLPQMELNQSEFRYKLRDDITRIQGKFNTTIFTLNYDQMIGKMMNMESNDLSTLVIKNNSRGIDLVDGNKINHLHGLINDDGDFEKNKLLTIQDYLSNQDNISQNIKKIFEGNLGHETIPHMFIIGSSMMEEHILKALKKVEDKKQDKEIIWLAYLPTEDYIFKRIESIYNKIGIKILNFNLDQNKSEKENFRIAWEIIVDFLMDNKKISDSYSIFNNLDYYKYIRNADKEKMMKLLSKLGEFDEKTANDIVSFSYLTQKISLYDMYETKINFPNKIKINSILIKNDDSIKQLNNEISQKYLDVMKTYIIKGKYDFNFDFDTNIREIYIFFKEHPWKEKLKDKDFEIFAKACICYEVNQFRFFDGNPILEAYQNKFIKLDELFNIDLDINQFADHKKNENLLKLVESNLKNDFSEYETPSIEQLKIIIKDERISRPFLHFITCTSNWNKFLLNNFNGVKKLFFESSIDLKHSLFRVMYYTYSKNRETEKKFLAFAKEQTDILKYPSSLYIIGRGGSDGPFHSNLDGKYIREIESFKDIEEMKEFVKTWNKKDKKDAEWWNMRDKFEFKLVGMKMPNNIEKMKGFVKEFCRIIESQNMDWIFFSMHNIKFVLKIDTIDNLISIMKTIKTIQKRTFWLNHDFPFEYWERELVNNFVNSQIANLENISLEEYKKLFLLQLHQIYNNWSHLTEKWFKKWKEFKKDKDIKNMATLELKKYIKDNRLVKQIVKNDVMDDVDISKENWDWLYFKWHYSSEGGFKLNSDDLLSILKKPGSLVLESSIAVVFRWIIYKEKMYDSPQKFLKFIQKICRRKNIKEIKKLSMRVMIYTLSKTGKKLSDSPKEFYRLAKFSDVAHIFRHYHRVLNDEIICEFIKGSHYTSVNNSYSEYYLFEGIEIKENIKNALAERMNKDIENMIRNDNDMSLHYSQMIKKTADKQGITLPQEAIRKIEKIAEKRQKTYNQKDEQ